MSQRILRPATKANDPRSWLRPIVIGPLDPFYGRKLAYVVCAFRHRFWKDGGHRWHATNGSILTCERCKTYLLCAGGTWVEAPEDLEYPVGDEVQEA